MNEGNFAQNEDGEDRVSLKLLKLQLIEARTRYEQAYAKAFLESPTSALRIFGLTRGKVSKDIMKQIATNDAEVREARSELDQLQRLVLASEESLEEENTDDDTLSQSEAGEEALSLVYLHEFGGSALEALEVIREQVQTIAGNIRAHTAEIDQKTGLLDREYWVKEIFENVAIYKNHLTDYLDLLKKIQRSVKNKYATSEVRSEIEHVKELRDDCKSLIELAKAQSWV